MCNGNAAGAASAWRRRPRRMPCPCSDASRRSADRGDCRSAVADLNALFNGPKRFVLQVSGESMIEAGILDGDLVVIERRDAARDGEIVVALIDSEEVTLKRIKQHRNGQIELIPPTTP